MATKYVGGESCTEDLEVLKKARDALIAAKPDWISMDYGATERLSNGDWAASVNWNGSTMRVRLNTSGDVQYGYPKEGFLKWQDNVAILADAQNVENAKLFLRDNPPVAQEIEMALRQNAGLIAEKFLQNGGPDANDGDGADDA